MLTAEAFRPLYESRSEDVWTDVCRRLIAEHGPVAVERFKHYVTLPMSRSNMSSTTELENETAASSSKEDIFAGGERFVSAVEVKEDLEKNQDTKQKKDGSAAAGADRIKGEARTPCTTEDRSTNKPAIGATTDVDDVPNQATSKVPLSGGTEQIGGSSGSRAKYNLLDPGDAPSHLAPDLNQGNLLLHLCVLRNFCSLIHTLVCDYDFDIDITRDSDRNTCMHLALFETRKKDMVEKLDFLGADLDRKNAYGVDCEQAFHSFNDSKENIIFLDLELTKGFYEREEEIGIPRRIIELACVITDKNLKELGRGSWVIGGFSKEFLSRLPYFHQKNFRDSECGRQFEPLVEPNSGYVFYGNNLFSDMISERAVTTATAERECLALLKEFCPQGACPLSGNSIQCDREILAEEMPEIYQWLSHRILDVSTFLGVAERWMPHKIEMWRWHQKQVSNYNHRALDDTLSSIQSMAWIRENLLYPSDHKLAEWEEQKQRWRDEEEHEWEDEEDAEGDFYQELQHENGFYDHEGHYDADQHSPSKMGDYAASVSQYGNSSAWNEASNADYNCHRGGPAGAFSGGPSSTPHCERLNAATSGPASRANSQPRSDPSPSVLKGKKGAPPRTPPPVGPQGTTRGGGPYFASSGGPSEVNGGKSNTSVWQNGGTPGTQGQAGGFPPGSKTTPAASSSTSGKGCGKFLHPRSLSRGDATSASPSKRSVHSAGMATENSTKIATAYDAFSGPPSRGGSSTFVPGSAGSGRPPYYANNSYMMNGTQPLEYSTSAGSGMGGKPSGNGGKSHHQQWSSPSRSPAASRGRPPNAGGGPPRNVLEGKKGPGGTVSAFSSPGKSRAPGTLPGMAPQLKSTSLARSPTGSRGGQYHQPSNPANGIASGPDEANNAEAAVAGGGTLFNKKPGARYYPTGGSPTKGGPSGDKPPEKDKLDNWGQPSDQPPTMTSSAAPLRRGDGASNHAKW